jgi:signal transduction histidine kinase
MDGSMPIIVIGDKSRM